ncbi:MAG: hypothetical protein HRU27_15350 [Rhizobiaceae bacterium]|nr:hypothetical protein [Hyphomicrobiales bacterium]NRB31965.1 hypothetical protein [Rhizobiaceae bacterium]
MRNATFGKRRLSVEQQQPEDQSTNSHAKWSDIIGLIILSVLVFLFFDNHYLKGQATRTFIDVICRVIEVPAGFANDWVLRSSIALPIVQALESPFGMLSLPSGKSFIVAAHQASLVIGLGAALFLDIYLAQFLKHRVITQHTLDLVRFGSQLVTWGLAAIWATGGAILLYYYLWAPELLQNPKIWAKLIIVLGLTINGLFIHRYAFNGLRNCLGRRVLDQGLLKVALTFLPLAAISVVSWGFAFLLGAFKELNNTYDAASLLSFYFTVLAMVYTALLIGCALMRLRTRITGRQNLVANVSTQ